MAARLAFSRRCLRQPKSWFDRLLFTDEKWFDNDDHGDSFEWIDTRDPSHKRSYREVTQMPAKLMVWGAIGIGFKFLLVIRQTELESRLDGDDFRRLVLMQLRKAVGAGSDRVLMQDGCKVHWTQANRQYIKRSLRMETLDGWPATSPGLNPIENLWAILQLKVGRRGPWGREELESYVRQEFDAIPQALVDKLVRSFPERLKKCVSRSGGSLK